MNTDNHRLEQDAAFRLEMNEALLSLDEERIRGVVRKWNGVEMPKHQTAFWGAVHKGITANTTLPLDFRKQSKEWLTLKGFQSWDDGELG
ncbi:MAG TPA: hypothetical protein VGH19_06475 [Verrucomicrobiae bacterium]